MTIRRLKVCTLILFFFLSGLDLGLTIVILRLGGDRFFEGNPIANWALRQAGWLGLTSFKTVSTMAVTGSCFAIASWRPRLGNQVLSFACASLLVVVGYSSALAGSTGIFCPHAIDRHGWDIERENALLKSRLADAQAYDSLYRHVWCELLAGRVKIADAADQLAFLAEERHSSWVPRLQSRFPGSSLRQGLEKHLEICLQTALQERFPFLGER